MPPLYGLPSATQCPAHESTQHLKKELNHQDTKAQSIFARLKTKLNDSSPPHHCLVIIQHVLEVLL